MKIKKLKKSESISKDSLKKAEREKTLILNSIVEHVIFQDTNHNIIRANKAAADSINMKVEDLIGKKCYSFWCNPDGPIKECPVHISLETKTEAEAEVKTPDGRVWHIKSYPVIDKNNKIIGTVEVANEITQLRLTQKNLKKSEKRYREAYNRSRFYKDLFAHDISNILQSILSSIELITLKSEEGSNINYDDPLIDIIKQQLKRGTRLASNVRKLSELEDSKITLEKIDIIKILKRSKKLIVDAFPQKNIQIKFNSDYDTLNILANDLVNEVFENIIINSVHHNINSIVEIEIKVSKEIKKSKRFFKLEFIDNGIGIPDTDKQKVFIRGDFEIENRSGSGLGLKLVKKLVDIYNGKIWIEDKIKGDHSFGCNCILLFPEAI
ncbi:MAG: PAS domain-containing protein [Candidatus Lokiarchaeota archaeon]|nr:PAS domain-containing protein [Candidatus Lokiarchaeota archaeon]